MISLTLNTKKCMAELLLRETFDSFLFIEGSVTTFNKFTIDGYIHSDFYEDDAPAESYSSWKSLREFVFSIIKASGLRWTFTLYSRCPQMPSAHSLQRMRWTFNRNLCRAYT